MREQAEDGRAPEEDAEAETGEEAGDGSRHAAKEQDAAGGKVARVQKGQAAGCERRGSQA